MDTFERLAPDLAAESIRAFLRDQLETTGSEGYVLGVSGGLDSAVAATLAVQAVGADRVLGLVLPGEPSDPANMADARDLCDRLDVEWYERSIDGLVTESRGALPMELSTLTVGNVRARMRMVLLYAAANERDLLVLGADNRSEIELGYFTKYGDGAVDVRSLADLYKTEVYDLARHLALDEAFIEKEPTAGLWEGQTDEKEIGVPYETIDPVLWRLERGVEPEEIVAETDADRDEVERLVEMRENSTHKRSRPPSPGLR